MTTDERLAELEKRCSTHLARRPVKVVWDRQGPSASGLGQVTKSMANEVIIYIAPMDDLRSRMNVWAHELAHVRAGDHKFVARLNDQARAPGCNKETPEARAAWRKDPREKRAQAQAAAWVDYSDKHKHEYWRVGRSEMECKLLCLLQWPSLDTNQPQSIRYKGAGLK